VIGLPGGDKKLMKRAAILTKYNGVIDRVMDRGTDRIAITIAR